MGPIYERFFQHWKAKVVFCSLAGAAAYFERDLPLEIRALGVAFLIFIVFVAYPLWGSEDANSTDKRDD